MKAFATLPALIFPGVCLGQTVVESGGFEADATGQVCESTGFEPQEAFCGWETGFMCGGGFVGVCIAPEDLVCTGDNEIDQNCCLDNPNPLNGWFTSIVSRHCNEPHIDTVNPASGTQHFRFSHDETGGDPPGCTGFGNACRQTASTPLTDGPLPVGRTVINFDIAMGGGPPGPFPPFDTSLQMLLVADHEEPVLGPTISFCKSGGVIIECLDADAPCGIAVLTGNGSYDNLTIDLNPCANKQTFTLTNAAGDVTGEFTQSFLGFSLTVERIFLIGDNREFEWDIDNFSIERGEPCIVGSCCNRNPGAGFCSFPLSEAECDGPNKTWFEGDRCREIECDQITGACCDGRRGTCISDTLIASCEGVTDGVWHEGVRCSEVACGFPGACCDRSAGQGSCLDDVLDGECVGQNEVWTFNTPCNEVTCDGIEGACCDALSGNCFVSTIGDCEAGADTTWVAGATCSEIACNAALSACCDAGSNNPTVATCTTTTLAACDCVKCTWTHGAVCEDVPCTANFQVIPTVSEWGLAILALTLLIVAKVRSHRKCLEIGR